MEDDRLALVAALFERVLELPPPSRQRFIADACAGDAALRRELESLLAAHASAPEYFDGLAERVVAPAYAAIAHAGEQEAASALLARLQAALGDRYRVERELGGGGMSRVFLAEELDLTRQVVIKVLPPETAAAVSIERFRREIRVSAQLQHPHIVPLLTAGSADSLLYYTMPFVAGDSLRTRLARTGPLVVADAIRIWRDVLEALTHAHASDVVHRDIKPANVLLGVGNAWVTDFGVARAIADAGGDALSTGAGGALGTPTYMAPEQLTGGSDADHRVDVYSAGLLMYEMLEGRLPFAGETAYERVHARVTTDPRPIGRADAPPALVDLVMRCIARLPADRPQGAQAVLSTLDALAGVPALAPGAGPRARRSVVALGAAAMMVVAAAIGATQWGSNRAGTTAPPTIDDASLVVLPLVNRGSGPDDTMLADGMTDALIATLGSTGQVRVIGRTSASAVQTIRPDIRAIADSLGVRYVLDGTFQTAGPRLRLELRLVDGRDGTTRWSSTYDRLVDDILAVQAEVTSAVALELGAGRSPPRRRPLTTSFAAYESYLRGMDVALLRSDSGSRLGIEYFRQAIAADPAFAAAHAGLARHYLNIANRSAARREWHARAEQAARTAVALDDSLAEARVALGWALLGRLDFAEAERELRRAITLDPSVPRGYEGLARALTWRRRGPEALAAAQRGVAYDPFSHSAIRELAIALSVNGRCDEALELLRPLKALRPPAGIAGIIGGQCHAASGRWSEAIAEFRWSLDNTEASAAPAFLAYALARGGQREQAERVLADLLAGRVHSHGAFGIATVYHGLGQSDDAFRWLDRAVDEGASTVYVMGPMYDELRRDPRFRRYEARMGL